MADAKTSGDDTNLIESGTDEALLASHIRLGSSGDGAAGAAEAKESPENLKPSMWIPEVLRINFRDCDFDGNLKKNGPKDEVFKNTFDWNSKGKDIRDTLKSMKADKGKEWEDLCFEVGRKRLPTLYIECEPVKHDPDAVMDEEVRARGSSKGFKKRFPLLMDQTLAQLRDEIRGSLMSGDPWEGQQELVLSYTEVIPKQSRFLGVDFGGKCICRICGIQVQIVLKKNGEEYINPHALVMYFANDRQLGDDLCTECNFLLNLGIINDDSQDSQTRLQPYLLVAGVLLSPAFWVTIALIVDIPILMLVVTILIGIASIFGMLRLLCACTKTSNANDDDMELEDVENQPVDMNRSKSAVMKYIRPFSRDEMLSLHKKAEDQYWNQTGVDAWFLDPYYVVPNNYMAMVWGSLVVLNLINAVELLWLYSLEDSVNFIFECSYADGVEGDCVVYFELIRSSSAVFMCMLFIHVGLLRRPFVDFRQKRAQSLNRLKAVAEWKGKVGDHGQKRKLCKKLVDGPVQQYYKYAIDVIEEVRRSRTPGWLPNGFRRLMLGIRIPTWRTVAFVTLFMVLVVLMTLIALYTHSDTYIDKMSNPYNTVPIVVAYLILWMFLYFYCNAMFKISMILDKAHTLMMISTNPLKMLVYLRPHEVDYDSNQNQNFEYATYVNDKLYMLTPPFLRAWSDLREHIQDWELRYFYELTQPIITLELVFVIVMFIYALYHVIVNYDADIRDFLVDLVSEAGNVVVMLVFFTVLVTATLILHLYKLLRAYRVQTQHEKWLEKVAKKVHVEQVNVYDFMQEKRMALVHRGSHISDATDNAAEANTFRARAEAERLGGLRQLMVAMKDDMKRNRAAPKLFGVLPLKEEYVEAILGAITTFLVAFVSSYVTATISRVTEASTDWTPTASPTSEPTDIWNTE